MMIRNINELVRSVRANANNMDYVIDNVGCCITLNGKIVHICKSEIAAGVLVTLVSACRTANLENLLKFSTFVIEIEKKPVNQFYLFDKPV